MNDRIDGDMLRAASSGSAIETDFALQLYDFDGAWIREHRFDPSRGWRFDFAELELRIAVEVEGHWGHRSTKRFAPDCQKYNAAAIQGWIVLRGDSGMVRSGELANAASQAVEARQSRKSGLDPGGAPGPA